MNEDAQLALILALAGVVALAREQEWMAAVCAVLAALLLVSD